ncbi:hypothetical protein [Phenylobacterium sp.]|uniref:hypothetical protein n=1 Tax=Phenylobacterium sp. TaxID=1871053 RepID=UPI00301C2DC2
MAALRGYIATHQALIAQYDPDGFTADDRIDFASTVDPRRAVAEFYQGRYVVFRLTNDGTADLVWAFETEAAARRMLARHPDHLVGRVASDEWSVELLA